MKNIAKLLSGTLLAHGLMTGMVAQAQVQATDDAQASEQGLDEIVITARRVSENLQTVPVAVSALTAASLENRQIRNPQDIQYVVPSLNFQRAQSDPAGTLSIGLRGQQASTVTMNSDPTVGIYIDGVNLPRTYGLRQNLVDIDRIEVLRGPQGTLYGRNSTGGALSIVTNDPTYEFGGQVQASIGNRNSYGLQAIANLPLSTKVALRIVGNGTWSHGYSYNRIGDRIGDEESYFVRAKLLLEPTENLTIKLAASYMDNDNGGGAFRLAGINPSAPQYGLVLNETAIFLGLAAPFTTPSADARAQAATAFATYRNVGFYDTNSTTPDRSTFRGPQLSANIDWTLSDSLSLRSITGFQHYVRQTREDLDGTPVTLIDVLQTTRAKFASQELQLLYRGSKIDGVAGVYGSYERGYEISNNSFQRPLSSGSTPSRPSGLTVNKGLAFFAQGNFHATEQLTLTAGGRYTWDRRGGYADSTIFNRAQNAFLCDVPVIVRDDPAICRASLGTTFKEPTWLLSASYQVQPSTMIYAKVSRGFRAGGFNVKGANALAYSAFAPEIALEYEVGLKGEFFDRRLRTNLAAYYDDYKDVQRSARAIDPVTGTTVNIIQNAARVKIKGIEAEITGKLTDGLTLSGTYAYTQPRYKRYMDGPLDLSGQPFAVPKHSGSIGLNHVADTGFGQVVSQLDYAYRSRIVLAPESQLLGPVTQRGYGLFNGKITVKLENADIDISVYGRNLADKKYLAGSLSLDGTLGYSVVVPGEPRSFGASVLKRF
ncbi:MAG: TonB-dependent receptor [Sphingobium sp.]